MPEDEETTAPADPSIELITPVLGLNPYVLIECAPDDDQSNEAGFDLKVKAGGGIADNDEVICLLLLLVESLTGVDAELYVRQVDIVRRAAGLDPLSAFAGAVVEAEQGERDA